MYAIIRLTGKQFKVEQGDKIIVDRLAEEEGKTITLTEVLLISKDGKTTVGAPLIDKASVKLKVLEHLKGDKIRVAKYKAKSRYRKVYGHRQLQTALEVVALSVK